VKLSFAKDIWGRGGEKDSYSAVLKQDSMAEGERWVWQLEPRRPQFSNALPNHRRAEWIKGGGTNRIIPIPSHLPNLNLSINSGSNHSPSLSSGSNHLPNNHDNKLSGVLLKAEDRTIRSLNSLLSALIQGIVI